MAKRKSATPLTKRELPVLAAFFARSNMGHGRAPVADVRRCLEGPRVPSLEEIVADLCQQFIESDEHYDWFVDEARGWLRDFRKEGTREYVLKHWPDVAPHFGWEG